VSPVAGTNRARAHHGATVGLSFAGEDTHSRRFASTISPDESNPVSRLDAQLLTRRSEQGTGADSDFKVMGHNHERVAYQL